MPGITESSKKSQIRNILLILSAAVLLALLASAYFVCNYIPERRYAAGEILLDPEVAPLVYYYDSHPATGKKTRFVFSNIKFSYYDPLSGKYVKKDLAMEAYKDFYALIARKLSVEEPEEDLLNFFSHPAAALTISVRPEADLSDAGVKKFQTLQFSSRDGYFRIEFYDAKEAGGWAYFYYPGIYTQMMKPYPNSFSFGGNEAS